eukprot:TRINITY_DN4723_c0_g1_i1.p1 TRINITY_DN4723_c0_g1~~TRINITY_DN4723_c0_g1_i1.p1  ORF type:complete len:632 (+),score=83.69 TRINITY_DN4723_c0_g1_i1:253-1896(+)
MGANALRVYAWNTADGVSHKDFLDVAHSYGLQVIVTYYLGTATETPIGTNSLQQAVVNKFVKEINKYLGHPAILAWAFGNEINGAWNGFLSQISDTNNCGWKSAQSPNGCYYDYGVNDWCTAAIKCVYEGFFEFLDMAASSAKNLMGDSQAHLMITSFADVDYIEQRIAMFSGGVDGIDVWGLQVYRGENFGTGDNDLLATFPKGTPKPLMITEFGVDAFNDPCGVCDSRGCTSPCYNRWWDVIPGFGEDEELHQQWDTTLFSLIIGAKGSGVVGGSIMAWVDEYWKTQISVMGCSPAWGSPSFNVANCAWKAHADCPNGDINYNSLCGYWLGSTSDKYVNEGWFGLNRIQKNVSTPGLDLLSPRKVYFTLRKSLSAVPNPPSTCAALYGQCGGQTWQGDRCCEGSFTRCVAHHKFYSQCEPICASSSPCWSPGVGCIAADVTKSNGRGLGHCANQTRCTDFSVCYEDDPVRCDCAYNKPCRQDTYPMTCTSLNSGGNCPTGSTLCALTAFDQCDGIDYYGPTTCPAGTTCSPKNPWLSQCTIISEF